MTRTEPMRSEAEAELAPKPSPHSVTQAPTGAEHVSAASMRGSTGTPVRAAESGFVFYAGDKWRGYGNAVALDHGSDITSLYGHLREIHVISGDAVPAGATIGTVGKTGNATTPHLHFEIRVGDQPVDPADYIEGMEKMK